MSSWVKLSDRIAPLKCCVSECPHDAAVSVTFPGRPLVIYPYCARHAQPHIESNKRSN